MVLNQMIHLLNSLITIDVYRDIHSFEEVLKEEGD